MPETIEAFVEKLRHEGVQAGRDAAEQHLAKARQEADQVLAQARAQAAKIVADAQAQADSRLAKSKTDLELAARDIALRLREALSRALREVLAAGAKGPLTDADFLGKLLYDIVTQYVRANLEETNMGYAKEVELIRLAHEMDLLTTPYVFGPADADPLRELLGEDCLVNKAYERSLG
jgi:vacuolar-type H+-ATPase subunit H